MSASRENVSEKASSNRKALRRDREARATHVLLFLLESSSAPPSPRSGWQKAMRRGRVRAEEDRKGAPIVTFEVEETLFFSGKRGGKKTVAVCKCHFFLRRNERKSDGATSSAPFQLSFSLPGPLVLSSQRCQASVIFSRTYRHGAFID